MVLTPEFLTDADQKLLAQARDTFGSTAQILVAVEELCELAAVCAKYPRYDSSEEAIKVLYERALDEVADVTIVLDHIINIFNLTPEDVRSRITGKLGRLERWLQTSDSMDITTKDREVIENKGCEGCAHVNDWDALSKGLCQQCIAGTKNHYTNKETAHDAGGV